MKYIRLIIIFFIGAIIISLVGAVVMVLSGKNPAQIRNIAILSPGEGVFQDTSLGISLRYPKEWEQHYVPPNIVLFSGKDGVSTMTLTVQKRKEEETLEEFSKKNSEEIKTSGTENHFSVETQEISDMTIDSHAAKRMRYHLRRDGKNIDGVQVWTVEKKMEYIITFAVPSEQFETAVQTFDNVLQSVRISHVKSD